MKLNEKIFTSSKNLIDQGDVQDIEIPQMNLISLERLDKLVVDPNFIGAINAHQNHLKQIEPVFQKFTQLYHLNLSFNHISVTKDVIYCENLEYLDLSTNRIQKLDNLSTLQRLKYLDVSDNYIDEIEDLKTESLEVLNISGNELEILFNFKHITRLVKLDFSKNKIKNLNTFHSVTLDRLNVVNGSNNEIGKDQAENLAILMKHFPNLQDLDLMGNDITKDKFYKYAILSELKLQKLDGIQMKQSNYEQIMQAGKAGTFDQAVKKTNQDYIERLNYENELRKGAKQMLRDQLEQVDNLFDKYQKLTMSEQIKFVNYIKAIENHRRIGNVLDLDDQQLSDWKKHVQENIIAEKLKFEHKQLKQLDQKDKYLKQKVNAGTLREKLYEIAMNDPNLWRELKSRELKQLVREQGLLIEEDEQMQQQQNNSKNYNNNNPNDQTTGQGRQYDHMQQYQQDEIGQKIEDKLKLLDDISDNQNMNRTNYSGYKDEFDQ